MKTAARFTLWLVRHPQPEIAKGLCYGRTDLPANAAHTQASARSLRQALEQRNGNRGDRPASLDMPVWTSPLQRCMQLTHALLAPFPLRQPPRIDVRLAEMDFGRWEGRPWSDIPATEFDAWMEDFPHHRPGEGECVAELMSRTRAAWHDTLATSLEQGHQEAVWITHAGVIRAMTLLQTGCALPVSAAQWPTQAPAFGEWTVLRFARSEAGLMMRTDEP